MNDPLLDSRGLRLTDLDQGNWIFASRKTGKQPKCSEVSQNTHHTTSGSAQNNDV